MLDNDDHRWNVRRQLSNHCIWCWRGTKQSTPIKSITSIWHLFIHNHYESPGRPVGCYTSLRIAFDTIHSNLNPKIVWVSCHIHIWCICRTEMSQWLQRSLQIHDRMNIRSFLSVLFRIEAKRRVAGFTAGSIIPLDEGLFLTNINWLLTNLHVDIISS